MCSYLSIDFVLYDHLLAKLCLNLVSWTVEDDVAIPGEVKGLL